MANNPNSTSYTTSRIVVNGRLSSDGTQITYTDNSGTEHTAILASTIFTTFKGENVELSITKQSSTSEEPSYS